MGARAEGGVSNVSFDETGNRSEAPAEAFAVRLEVKREGGGLHQAEDLVGEHIDLGDFAGGRADAPGDELPRSLVNAPQRGFNLGRVLGAVELHREEQLDRPNGILDHRLPAIHGRAEPLCDVAPRGLAGLELVQPRFGHRLDDGSEKPFLTAEVIVDGRGLHSCSLADLIDGHPRRPGFGCQIEPGLQDSGSSARDLDGALAGLGRHIAITIYMSSRPTQASISTGTEA